MKIKNLSTLLNLCHFTKKNWQQQILGSIVDDPI
jgi:hypothetical protein